MAIDFPASPTVGQTFVVGSVTYTWDGVKWTAAAGGGGGGLWTEASGALHPTTLTNKVLVGTASAKTNFENSGTTPQFQIEATSLNGSSLSILRDGNDAGGPKLFLAHGRTDAGLVSNGDELGGLVFSGGDGGEFVSSASIAAVVDGNPGADDMPGRLVFSTTPSGSTTPVARVTIDSSGKFLVGKTASDFTQDGFEAWGDGRNFMTKTSDYALLAGRKGTDGDIMLFDGPAGRGGSISVSGTTLSYNTSSDYRLKENIVPLTGATDRVNQLKVCRFNFTANPDATVDGFIAHEAQAVVPECVTGKKDAVDADGNPVYQGIDQSKLVPLLTAALQEAMTRIEQLEAKVTALESK